MAQRFDTEAPHCPASPSGSAQGMAHDSQRPLARPSFKIWGNDASQWIAKALSLR
jgi:hypothetical protein